MTQWEETYSQIRPHIWKKSELSRLRFKKIIAPDQWDVIQHVQIGATEGATWMGWAAKMEAPRPLVNHPSSLNLQTFKPSSYNLTSLTSYKKHIYDNDKRQHDDHVTPRFPPFPEVEPPRSSVQGAGPAQGQWCQAQRPEHQGTVQTMPCKSWKSETLGDFRFRMEYFFPVLSEIQTLH